MTQNFEIIADPAERAKSAAARIFLGEREWTGPMTASEVKLRQMAAGYHRPDVCCHDVVRCQSTAPCVTREAYREYAKTDELPGNQAAINEATHGLAPGPVFLSDATAQLTTDSAARKEAPVFSGVMKYFPLALMAIARLSKIGNDKHNPGEPLHWSREKSSDHGDCIVRHQIEAGTLDADGELHDVKVAWRSLAQLQLAEEKRLGK